MPHSPPHARSSSSCDPSLDAISVPWFVLEITEGKAREEIWSKDLEGVLGPEMSRE